MDTASRTLTGTTARIGPGRPGRFGVVSTTVRNAASRPAARRAAAVALATIAVVALLGAAARPSDGRSDRPATPAATTITGGEPGARAAVTWALERYEGAGLRHLPAVEIHLHASDAGCRGELGYYRAGRIDLCTAASSEPYQRKFALHELAHAWTAAHLDSGTGARFLELRGLGGWNASGDPWKERGIEQAAEIVAWGLGEGEIVPLLPEPATVAELTAAFELLTGERPITTAA